MYWSFGLQCAEYIQNFGFAVEGKRFKRAAWEVEAEAHSGVDSVLGGAAFGEQKGGLVDQRGLDAAGDFGIWLRGDFGGKEETLPGFAAQIAAGDLGFERREGVIARVVAHRGIKALGGGEVDVGTDQINQGEGAKAVACGQHRGVDFRGGMALFQEGQGLAVIGARTAVDDETGAVGALDDGFSGGLGDLAGSVDGFGRGAGMGGEFNQPHRGGRVEEMQGEQVGGGFQGACDVADGDGRGVGGEDGAGGDGLELGEESLLGVKAFDDRLDDHCAGFEGGKIVGDGQVFEGGIASGFGEFSGGDAGVQSGLHTGAG